MKPYKTFAWLVVSDFGDNLEAVTAMVGLDPSESYLKGDPWRGEAKRFTSSWIYKSPADKSAPLEQVLDELLVILEQNEAGVISAGNRFSTQIGIAAYFRESLPILNFSREMVSRISRLGCSLDIDTYQLPA